MSQSSFFYQGRKKKESLAQSREIGREQITVIKNTAQGGCSLAENQGM